MPIEDKISIQYNYIIVDKVAGYLRSLHLFYIRLAVVVTISINPYFNYLIYLTKLKLN
jgi:hypothetical protein